MLHFWRYYLHGSNIISSSTVRHYPKALFAEKHLFAFHDIWDRIREQTVRLSNFVSHASRAFEIKRQWRSLTYVLLNVRLYASQLTRNVVFSADATPADDGNEKLYHKHCTLATHLERKKELRKKMTSEGLKIESLLSRRGRNKKNRDNF